MNGKSTVKSLIALTMAGAMVFSMNTMPVSAAKKKTKAKTVYRLLPTESLIFWLWQGSISAIL